MQPVQSVVQKRYSFKFSTIQVLGLEIFRMVRFFLVKWRIKTFVRKVLSMVMYVPLTKQFLKLSWEVKMVIKRTLFLKLWKCVLKIITFKMLVINIFRTVSFKPLLQVLVYVFHYWTQQFIGERTRILNAWITIFLG